MYGRSGIDRADIGAFYAYDGFATQVIYTLERFGFCKGGEGFDWVQDGRIDAGGELPVNTSGGHLSEGHTNGWARRWKSSGSCAAPPVPGKSTGSASPSGPRP